ncbi:MAG: hypothetical protein NZX77_21630, partial [Polyangiaceae bacterium]|nr:hypothetical protein [Polyangiaceae bacterium]
MRLRPSPKGAKGNLLLPKGNGQSLERPHRQSDRVPALFYNLKRVRVTPSASSGSLFSSFPTAFRLWGRRRKHLSGVG